MLHLLTQKCKGWVHKILTNMNEITNNLNLSRKQNQYNPIYKKKIKQITINSDKTIDELTNHISFNKTNITIIKNKHISH